MLSYIGMENVKTIGKDYTITQLIRFVFSPVITQILLSLLMSLDDSLFITRFIGTEGLAAFSILWPVFMFFDSISCIFTAAATYCSGLMGEKKNEEAYSAFSTTAILACVFGLVCTIVIRIFIKPILSLLGCTQMLWPLCMDQYRVQCWFISTSFVSRLFSTFYVVAGKPKVATFTTLVSTILNVFFDYLFTGVLRIGMAGTAYANGIGHIFNIIFGLYFFTRDECEVKLGKPNCSPKVLVPTLIKIGFPRTATNLAMSVNSIISHRVLLAYSDETALSANTIVNTIQYMFMAGYFGLADSISPIICYAHGEKNVTKLKRTIKQYFQITLGLTAFIIVLYLVITKPLLNVYLGAGNDLRLRQMCEYGLRISPYAFIFFGLTINGGTIFTNTLNSKVSTFITIMENVVFSNLTVIGLPYLFGINGYWYSFIVTEALTSILTIILLIKKRHYLYIYEK